MKALPMSSARAAALLFICISITSSLLAQIECPGGPFPDPKQRLVNNVTIPGAPAVLSYVEHLPDDYSSTGNKKYPLFIWFHGVAEQDGDVTGCRLFGEWFWVPPSLVELRKWPYSVKNQTGETFKFILISPRMSSITTATINPLIDYLIKNYKVDPARVYLSGISAGANFIMAWAGENDNNARRVAGIAPVAPCDVVNTTQARVISRNNLHVYAVKCSLDNCGAGNGATVIANTINSINPSANLAWASTLPVGGWPCNSYAHDSWGTAYDTNFKVNIYGRNINLYEWMVQFRSSAASPLPVALEDYDVRLSNGKVYVKWKTSAENNSDHFTIERAGVNQQFTALTTVPAAGNSTGVKTYEWVDDHPLNNISFYRLTQTDKDGQQQYFPVRKVLNRIKWDHFAIVSPNPFNEELTVFINVDKVQRVAFTITDMSGRVIKQLNGIYNEGAAEVRLDAVNMPRGVYFLKVAGENISETHKIIKQ